MTVYDGWVTSSVRRLKYHREKDRVTQLAEEMIPALRELGKVDALIPVPLHPNRQDWRGFNQAELLARRISDIVGLPVEMALTRVKDTNHQTGGDREERLANMDDAFQLDPNWSIQKRRHYVLIDDVYTTGATLGACADVLESAGASVIFVLTVAFDLQPRELEAYKQLVIAASP